MIAFVFYKPEDRTLRIQFHRGTYYDYFLVPPDVGRQAEVSLAAGDAGFFRSSIRGIYPYRKL